MLRLIDFDWPAFSRPSVSIHFFIGLAESPAKVQKEEKETEVTELLVEVEGELTESGK